MLTIESSVFENNSQTYVAEMYDQKNLNYYQTNSSQEYNNCRILSLVRIALYVSSIAFKHMIQNDIDLHLLSAIVASLIKH